MKLIYKLFQTSLLVFNTVYFIIGILFILTSIVLYLNSNYLTLLVKTDLAADFNLLLDALIIFGLVFIAIGAFGTCGIVKESSCIIFVYFTFLFLIFSFQFTAGVCLYLKSDDYFKKFSSKLQDAIKLLYGKSSTHTLAIDYIHRKFKCCGWSSPYDWFESLYIDQNQFKKVSINSDLKMVTKSNSFYNNYMYKVPQSCCVNEFEYECVLQHKFHEIGCEPSIKIYYKQFEVYVIWTLALLTVLQLILLLLSLYVMCILFFDKKSLKRSDSSSSSFRTTTSSHSFSSYNYNKRDKKANKSVFL